MPDAKIKVTELCLKLSNKQLLRNISLEIPTNSKTAVIGPAASGKTVLMKCLAGIFKPDQGSIEIDGFLTTGADGQKGIDAGILFQKGGLFDSLPVWENVSFKLINALSVGRAEAKRIAIEKLALVDLSAETADLLPAQLSGGMQKRVGLARALASNPSLLLLDDPTAGLDPITTTRINNLIEHSRRKIGATVLAITSDMQAARSAYDYLFMLHEGMLVWSGRTSEIDTCGNDYVQQLINGRREGPIKMRLRARRGMASEAYT
jgi:phospholipid/cholesterol/gamma-HCH transport system ATP-binding protein